MSSTTSAPPAREPGRDPRRAAPESTTTSCGPPRGQVGARAKSSSRASIGVRVVEDTMTAVKGRRRRRCLGEGPRARRGAARLPRAAPRRARGPPRRGPSRSPGSSPAIRTSASASARLVSGGHAEGPTSPRVSWNTGRSETIDGGAAGGGLERRAPVALSQRGHYQGHGSGIQGIEVGRSAERRRWTPAPRGAAPAGRCRPRPGRRLAPRRGPVRTPRARTSGALRGSSAPTNRR